nr:DNA-directed DNA polymerase [Tanacetum cinerariifolium]
FFIIAVQTPGNGISILLAVGTPSTGSGNLYCQWELSPGNGNALKGLSKNTKKQSKPDKIEHEIAKIAQKPDPRTFSVQVIKSKALEKPNGKRSNRRRVLNVVELEIRTIEEVFPMADRTMEELLQAPMEGYGEAIVISEILAENFKIKTNLLQLVQTNKFHSFERDNPHTHISNLMRMTATLKYRDVSNDANKLMLFPYSLEGAGRIWYEKEPPNSILTWDDLVNKFVNQFFPPSKTTHLKNEISRFTQRFEETFGVAWDHFKEMLRACPHHGFLKLTQIDTSYNGLNEQDQDSLIAAAGGNLLNKTTREALKIIENKLKVCYSKSKSNVSRVNTNSRDNVSKTNDRIDKLTDQISNLVEIVNKQVITHATAKAVEKTCVIYGGAHAYYDCIATDSNQPSVCANNQGYRAPMNNAPNFQNQGFQNQPFQVPNNQFQPGIPNELSSYIKSNEIMIKSMQNQITVLRGDFNKQEENLRRNLNNDMRSILGSFLQNQASTLGTLSSNIVPNLKGEMKAVTTRSGLTYEGPSILTNSPLDKVVERDTEEITEKEHSNCQGSTAQVQPSVVPISIPELDVLRTQPKPTIPYPSRLNDQKLREKATNQMEKFFQIIHDLHFDISFADALLWMPKFSSTIKKLTHTLMTLELADRSITRPKGVARDVFVKVGKFYFPTDFVVVDFEADPRVPLILGRSFLRTGCALIDVYGEEITLRYNPKSSNPSLVSNPLISKSDFCKEPIVKSSSPTLTPFGESDFFLEEIEDFLNDESIPTGIKNSFYDPEGDILYLEKLLNEDPFQLPPMDLKQAEETKAKYSIEEPPELELKELPSHLEYTFLEESDKLPVIIAKDLKDIEKEALIKEDYKPPVQSQRRVNPKIYDVIKKEVIKLLDADMIYPISDSPWVSPIHCVPKKGGMTVVANENNELIPTRLVIGWRVCIDYRKLNDATRKDHFSLPFMDQMLERLTGNEFYCFLDGFSGEGIVLGHKISKSGIEVNRAKVDVIAKLPHPTTVKGVRSFLVDYLSKWVEAKALPTNDARVVVKFLKSFFSRFGIPRAIISDRGTHFCNDQFTRVMIKYGVTHRLATVYHPQMSGQGKVSNHGLKRILKRTVGENHASWKAKNSLVRPFHDHPGFSYGTVELSQPNGPNFKVNGHCVKHYFGGDIPSKVVPDLYTFPMEK